MNINFQAIVVDSHNSVSSAMRKHFLEEFIKGFLCSPLQDGKFFK